MRTQIAKTWYLPAEYIPPTFWLVPPPPIPQVDGGGCYREKFFLILFFVSPIWFLLVFYFFIFFIFPDFRLIYPILGFQLNRFQNIVSTRYNISLRIFSFALRFPTLIIILDSVFFDSIFRLVFTRWILLASISTCFSIVDSML